MDSLAALFAGRSGASRSSDSLSLQRVPRAFGLAALGLLYSSPSSSCPRRQLEEDVVCGCPGACDSFSLVDTRSRLLMALARSLQQQLRDERNEDEDGAAVDRVEQRERESEETVCMRI